MLASLIFNWLFFLYSTISYYDAFERLICPILTYPSPIFPPISCWVEEVEYIRADICEIIWLFLDYSQMTTYLNADLTENAVRFLGIRI